MRCFFHVLKFSRRFRSDDRGVVAMIYGPMCIVLLLAAGVAVDYGRTYLVKKEISRALDSAVLAAGSMASSSESDMRAMAQRYFDANISPKTKIKYNPQMVFDYNSAQGTVTASSSATVETTLMRIGNFNYVVVRAEAVAGQNLSDIEIALVLDNSGSMRGSKISSLITAAKQLVDTMYEKDGSEDFVKFALVPFTAAVNIGTENGNADWIDNEGASDAAQQDFATKAPNEDTYWDDDTYKGMTGNEALAFFDASWKGCVRSRIGEFDNQFGQTVGFDVWDVTPDEDDANTKWAKMIKPVSGQWYDTDSGFGGFGGFGGHHGHHGGGSDDGPSDSDVRTQLEDVDDECPDAQLAPLTNNQVGIKQSIGNMVADGWTNIPNAVAWGWRVLSPDAPFTQGEDYTETNVKKVIVVLTDGQNDVGNYDHDPTEGSYSSYGMTAYGNLGTGYPGTELNDRLAQVCANAKTQGILVYSITFQLNDTNTQNLMRDCATKPDMYFNSPSNAALQDAFREIAVGLQQLRLLK